MLAGIFCHHMNPWIEAIRFRTLPVSIAGVLSAVALNVADGTLHLVPALLCLIFALLCQTASNFANEYFDFKAGRDRVDREGPRRGVTEGDISPRAMLLATVAVLAVAVVVGLTIAWYGGWWLIALGVLVTLGVLAYSTGPWPLSTHCLGEVAVVFFFGFVPVVFTYYVQAHSVNTIVVLTSFAIGLQGANVLIVNNYRDADDDAAVNKHTLANTLGRRLMPWLYFTNALVAGALWLPAWHLLPDAWVLVPLFYVAAATAVAIRISSLDGRRLNPFLGITAMLMFVQAALFLVAALLHNV